MLLQASFYIIGTVCIWKGRIIIKNAFKRGAALILSAAFALAIAVFAAHAEGGLPDEAAADLLLTQAAESEPAEEGTTAPGQPAEQETEPEMNTCFLPGKRQCLPPTSATERAREAAASAAKHKAGPFPASPQSG